MKKQILSVVLATCLGFVSVAQGASLPLVGTRLEVDNGAFWIRKWTQNTHQGIDLRTVTNYDSALLMTFSGADFAGLNQARATTFKSDSPSTATWNYTDSKIDYTRTYETKDDEVMIHVVAKFKEKPPEKAFLNLVSHGMKDDPEQRDREVFYYANSKIERKNVDKEIEATEVTTPAKWVGLGSRYFIFAVIPEGAPAEKILLQSVGDKAAQASLQFPVVNNAIDLKFRVIFVPKQLDLLRSIDPSLDTTVNLGFFTFLAYPILWLLKYIYRFVGNWGLAIIVLTLLVKVLTFPLVLKSMKSMRKMSEVQPQIKALQEKYKDDKARLNQEMMSMMKTSGYNPMAGCLPMLLQMPIFFALYSVLYAAVELYRAPFPPTYIHDLSARDPYFITPILMTVVMFVQQRLTPPSPGMDETQRKVMMFMPLMFGAFMLTTPAGLCVYMLVNALASVAQQRYLNKKLGPAASTGMMTGF